MSYEFGFAAGKAREDGPIRIVFDSKKYKILDLGEDVLSVNENGYVKLNQMTENKFFEFIKGEGYNQRYMLLKPQQGILNDLKMYIPQSRNYLSEITAVLFERFITQCENLIKDHGDEALLLIY